MSAAQRKLAWRNFQVLNYGTHGLDEIAWDCFNRPMTTVALPAQSGSRCSLNYHLPQA